MDLRPESANLNPPRQLRFDRFIIDFSKRTLRREGEVIPLTAKTFDVLAFLVTHRNRVVDKDEFLATVWPGTIVLEANLVRQVSLLRRALGQGINGDDLIVTIPGRGYQFVADAEEVVGPAASAGIERGPTDTAAHAGELDVHVEPLPPQRAEGSRFKVFAIAAAVVAIFALAIAAFQLVRSREIGGAEAAKGVPNLRPLTFDAAFPRDASWSPDGKRIVFTSDKAGNPDLWIQSLAGAELQRLTFSTAVDGQPHWSPTGSGIVYRSEASGGGLFVISDTGGSPKQLTNFGYGPKWTADGRRVVFSDDSVRVGTRRLFVIDVASGRLRELEAKRLQAVRSESLFRSVNTALDPDGSHVSIWARGESGFSFSSVNLLDGSEFDSEIGEEIRNQVQRSGLRLSNFVWAPSGRVLYFEGDSPEGRALWRVAVDPTTKRWLGGPERLSFGTTHDTDLAISPDGKRLAFTSRSTRTRLWSLPFNSISAQLTGPPSPVTSDASEALAVDASKDGHRLAFRVLRGGREEVWAYSLESGQQRLLLSSNTPERGMPVWSSDGAMLAYSLRTAQARSTRTSKTVAILGVRDGTESAFSVPGDLDYFVPRDWSSDGRSVTGTCRPTGAARVGTCIMRIGSDQVPIAVDVIASDPARSLFCQRFSPNQQWVSFVAIDSREPGKSRAYILPAHGGEWIAVTDGLSFVDKPRWAPDGRTLYFLSDRDGSLNLWARRIDPSTGRPHGEPFQVTSFNSPAFRLPASLETMEFAVARDRLFLPMTETDGAIWVLENLEP